MTVAPRSNIESLKKFSLSLAKSYKLMNVSIGTDIVLLPASILLVVPSEIAVFASIVSPLKIPNHAVHDGVISGLFVSNPSGSTISSGNSDTVLKEAALISEAAGSSVVTT